MLKAGLNWIFIKQDTLIRPDLGYCCEGGNPMAIQLDYTAGGKPYKGAVYTINSGQNGCSIVFNNKAVDMFNAVSEVILEPHTTFAMLCVAETDLKFEITQITKPIQLLTVP